MKVLIVDDSVVFRMAIKQALGEVPGVEVVGALSNGQLAVDFLKKGGGVDLITLDMEMPVLDGLETIKAIREIDKEVPIVVFSALTTKGAEKTIQALQNGANDFVTKQEAGGANSIDKSLEMIRQSLLPMLKEIQQSQFKTPIKEIGQEVPKKESKDFTLVKKPRLIVMASSTGGPEALGTIFRSLKPGANTPILLVQHMPPVFTQKLAEMLSKISPGYDVCEATSGMELKPSTCYIAPGDYHMVLTSKGTLELNQGEKVCFVRPAANVLFESVANNYNQQVASIVLTGMGDDGALGVKALSQKGSYNFYQSKRTCTVFGMPAAVERMAPANEIELQDVATLINEINARI